jgi:hypothetical protein
MCSILLDTKCFELQLKATVSVVNIAFIEEDFLLCLRNLHEPTCYKSCIVSSH